MKALLVLYFINFILFVFATDLHHDLADDNTPGIVHSLYEQHYSSYKKYLKEFKKEPDSKVAEPIRLLQYAKNIKAIKEHNERYEKGLESYERGLNEMSDWTDEELKGLLGFDPNAFVMSGKNITRKMLQKRLKVLPRSVDYRKKGVVGPVQNQNPCGNCFIFAALAALESYLAMRTHKPVETLSVQNAMDCGVFEKCHGNGGTAQEVWKWISEGHGVMSESDYPYKNADGYCLHKPNSSKAAVQGYATLPLNDELAVKQVLATYGPIAVSLHASLNSFTTYKGGIYYDERCPNDMSSINHAVTAVGYGEEDGLEYYIIKNSWGTNWGENGFGRIAFGFFACGIGRFNAIPIL